MLNVLKCVVCVVSDAKVHIIFDFASFSFKNCVICVNFREFYAKIGVFCSKRVDFIPKVVDFVPKLIDSVL